MMCSKSSDASKRPQRMCRKSKSSVEAKKNAFISSSFKSTLSHQVTTKSGRVSKLSTVALEAQFNDTLAVNSCLSKTSPKKATFQRKVTTRSGRTVRRTTSTSKMTNIVFENQLSEIWSRKFSLNSPKSSECKNDSKSPLKIPTITLQRSDGCPQMRKAKDKQCVTNRTAVASKKQKKSLKLNNLTVSKLNLFEKALSVLHSSAVPSSLPCRENEFFAIYNFIKGKLLEASGGCMYISGVPGTGKTATVYEVIRSLREECEIEDTPEFKFVEINGLQLTDPYQCYVQLFKELTGKKASSQNAANLLDKRFIKPAKNETEPIVLLVDELDLLCTRKQTILYHLFEWPNKPRSNLIVISIANTMDLPERVMMNRVSSRLGMSRLTFQPYNHKELQAILESRLEGLDAFDCDGVQLIARKVAAISGDARRALDICRRAVEIGESESENGGNQFVTMKHVDKALQDIFSSPRLMAIRNASLQEQTFLRSVVQDFRITGLEEAKFIDVYRHHCSMCKFEGFYTPTTNELFQVASNLFDIRLILIDNNSVSLQRRIRLQVSVDDVMFALHVKQ